MVGGCLASYPQLGELTIETDSDGYTGRILIKRPVSGTWSVVIAPVDVKDDQL